jgi:hypothetical protein
VKGQPWANNYIDGYCGIRVLNDGFDNEFDPSLDTFVPTDLSSCSNIADNPIFTTLQDKLIGILSIVATRRAKYLAVSQLTVDYMDTTGRLNTLEGELKSGQLISMIMELGQFGLNIDSSTTGDASTLIESTFIPPQRPDIAEFKTANDFQTRFKQYIENYNDKATYSLACVLDGNCPVNYKDQVIPGNK